jgi:hypothetical protein
MNDDDLPRRLHDRATRGEALSNDERHQLDAWYARQDREEAAKLAERPPRTDNTNLQSQLDTAVSQVAAVTLRIQSLAAENDTTRREVAALHRQLAQRLAPHSA